MRVCHIVPSLEDRHGGPSKSVRALANAEAGLGLQVTLATSWESGQPMAPGGADPAPLHVFPRVAPRWLSRSPDLRDYLRRTEFDLLHHHSLWLLPLRYAHEAARRAAVPLVISPRGMMSGWAHRHRRGRKWLAEHLVHPGAFAAAAGWHATSREEADAIRTLGWKQPVCVSPNGVPLPDDDTLAANRATWQELCPATRSRPVALFYSRFHRKKRLRELIELWLAKPRGDWFLLIAGVAEDCTAAELTASIAAAGASDHAAVFDGTDRPPPYAVASLFLLPSHSENFGLVIAEALAAGVPALVTDTTPWSGLGPEGCGWCCPWESYAAKLTAALATPAEELARMGQSARGWMRRDFSWAHAAQRLGEFYQHLRDERR